MVGLRAAGRIISTVRKQRVTDADAQLAFFFPPFHSVQTPVRRMVLLTFRVNFPSSVNSLWKDLHRHLLGDSKSVELTMKGHCHKLLESQFGRNDTFLKGEMKTKESLACPVSIWCRPLSSWSLCSQRAQSDYTRNQEPVNGLMTS